MALTDLRERRDASERRARSRWLVVAAAIRSHETATMKEALRRMAEIETVEQYIEAADPRAQPMLRELRGIVRAAAPDAGERLKYGMPTYELAGQPLLNFGRAKRHVAVYGLVHEDAAVPRELAPYLEHRSTLRFPIGEVLPRGALDAAIRAKVEDMRKPSS